MSALVSIALENNKEDVVNNMLVTCECIIKPAEKCRARHKAWQLEDLGLWDNFPTACVADVAALLVLSIYNTMDKCSSNITETQLSSICYCPFKMSSVTVPGFTRTTNSVRLQDETKISKFLLLLCTNKDSLKRKSGKQSHQK